MVLSIFNLVEIYYSAISNLSENEADAIFEQYRENVVAIPDEVLRAAMKFRKKGKDSRLSYADCIGYVYALQNNLKFLTGDKEFEGLDNVEFVK